MEQGDGPRSPKLAQADRPLAGLQTPSAFALRDWSAGGTSCSRIAATRARCNPSERAAPAPCYNSWE